MSGFGLKALKKKQTDENEIVKKEFFPTIVVGDNLAAFLIFQKLTLQEKPVKWLTSYNYSIENAEKELLLYPESVRDEQLKSKLIELDFNIDETQMPVSFYKDGKLYPFEGRAKVHELKAAEEYFQDGHYHFSTDNFIKISDEKVKENQLLCQIDKIEKLEIQDLANEVKFGLTTGKNEVYECSMLYYCESPKKFVSLLANKEALDEDFISSLVKIQGQSALTLCFENPSEFLEPQTILLPQSQTYEKGSVVCDVLSVKEVEKVQLVKATVFLEDDEKTEEELAKKVKLAKRLISKVSENFKPEKEPLIKYFNEFFMEGLDQVSLKVEGLEFSGHHSLLSSECSSRYFSRLVLSV